MEELDLDKPRLFSITQAARIVGLRPTLVKDEFFKKRDVSYNRMEHYLTIGDIIKEEVKTYGKPLTGKISLYDDGYLLTEFFLLELSDKYEVNNEYLNFITLEVNLVEKIDAGYDAYEVLEKLEKLEIAKEKWISKKCGKLNEKGKAGR